MAADSRDSLSNTSSSCRNGGRISFPHLEEFEKEESLVAEIVDLEEVGAEVFGVEDEVVETVPVVFDLFAVGLSLGAFRFLDTGCACLSVRLQPQLAIQTKLDLRLLCLLLHLPKEEISGGRSGDKWRQIRI